MNRAPAPALALLLVACAWVPACGLNQAGVTPPEDTIAFPASAVMDQGGNWLFVTNSNADLRYNDGTLLAFSLARVTSDRDTTNLIDPSDPSTVDDPVYHHEEWTACTRVNYPNPRTDDEHLCCFDALDRNILNCDERQYIGSDADITNKVPSKDRGGGNVRIGSFAAGMVRQRRVCPSGSAMVPSCPDICMDADGDDRLLIGVRGDTSLTFVDVKASPAGTPPGLTCSTESAEFATCDDGYRVNETGSAIAAPTEDEHPPEITLPDEPYALAIDETLGLLFIGHLSGNTARPPSGGFSLFDVMPIGEAPLGPPRLIGPFSSPFTPNSVGSVGVTAMKFTNGGIYASSRYVPQVAQLGVTGVCPEKNTAIREIAAFPVGNTYTSPLTGAETRGIEFVGPNDGPNYGPDSRAFILQRTPPALIAFADHTTVDRSPTDILETCGSPTFLDKHDSGVGPRLFVTCSADGEIYVYDPAVPELVKTFIVGRGPAGLVFDDARQVAYSVNFGDNSIAVIDLAPGSLTEYHVIQRIGFPRVSPR
jgi:hypothetical protein